MRFPRVRTARMVGFAVETNALHLLLYWTFCLHEPQSVLRVFDASWNWRFDLWKQDWGWRMVTCSSRRALSSFIEMLRSEAIWCSHAYIDVLCTFWHTMLCIFTWEHTYIHTYIYIYIYIYIYYMYTHTYARLRLNWQKTLINTHINTHACM